MEYLKLGFLFIGVLFTIVDTLSLRSGDIPIGNTITQAVGTTGFIWMQWCV